MTGQDNAGQEKEGQLRRITGSPLSGETRRLLLSILLLVAVAYYGRSAISSLRPLFIIILVSLFLSFAMEPAVNKLEALGLRRGLGTGIVFLSTLALFAGFGFAIGSVLADQLNQFVRDFDANIDNLEGWLQRNINQDIHLQDVRDNFAGEDGLGQRLTGFADDLLNFGATVVNVLFQAFTIGLFTFYLVAEGPRFRRLVCSVLEPAQQREVLWVWDIAVEKTGGYILSRSILALISTLFHWGAFAALGVPFPLPMALWVGVMSQFIPVVGTYFAGALPVLLALLEAPRTGVIALIIVVVYQQIENYLIAPRVTARTMNLHVVTAFGAVLAGGYLLGPVGALLALPFAATVQAFISTSVTLHEVEEKLLEESQLRRGRTRVYGQGRGERRKQDVPRVGPERRRDKT